MRVRSYACAVRRVLLLLAPPLLLAACVSSTDDTTSTSESPTTTTTLAMPEPADLLLVSSIDGEARVIDELGMVLTSFDTDTGSAYRQPVWSADGSVLAAFTSVDDGHGIDSLDPMTGERRWRAPTGTPPFYFLPAPMGSASATTSLRNAADGSGLVAELIDRAGSLEEIATVEPFYASWSPDGSALAIHREGRVAEIRTEGSTETIAEPTGVFQAPVWTEDGLILLRVDGDDQFLSVWDGASFRDVVEVEGPARFSAVGGRVAIQSIADDPSGGVQASVGAQSVPALPGGRLMVVDLETGELQTVSSVLTPIFQWDPTGTRLLFASFESDEALEFRWNVWEDDSITEGPTWQAQPVWFRDVVPFFDQYVQSISLWSSDGSAYAYPEVIGARPVVTIRSLDGTEPVIVEDATWVTWQVPQP